MKIIMRIHTWIKNGDVKTKQESKNTRLSEFMGNTVSWEMRKYIPLYILENIIKERKSEIKNNKTIYAKWMNAQTWKWVCNDVSSSQMVTEPDGEWYRREDVDRMRCEMCSSYANIDEEIWCNHHHIMVSKDWFCADWTEREI